MGKRTCALFSRVWLEFTHAGNEYLNVHRAGRLSAIQKSTLGRCPNKANNRVDE